MIRKKKLFSRPKKSYESGRIQSENETRQKYGLKNKKEIWKTSAKVKYFRKRAMALAKSSLEEQEVLIKKLQNLGLKITSLADILDLNTEDLLERRLVLILYKKGLSNSPRHARQLIVHKKVLINGKATSSPSYLVSVSEENHISIKEKHKAPKQKPAEESLANALEIEKEVENA
mgnify:CR=1 FL=1